MDKTSKCFLFSFLSMLLFSLVMVFPDLAFAATVKSVKGKRVVIDIGKDKLKRGQILEILGKDGKVRGVVKIQRIKGRSALAVLGKGRADSGDDVRPRQATKRSKVGSKSSRKSKPARTSTTEKQQAHLGFIAGMSMNSATVDLRNPSGVSVGTVDLSGTGFSAKGIYDYPLLPFLTFRALGGIEQFNVGGANNSECGGECNAEITYLTLDFWGRFPLTSGATKVWIGGGFDLLFPLSKSATALDEASITNTSILGIGGGLDWPLSPKTYIPVQIEYGLYPSSDQVKAGAIMIRAGYAWRD